MEKKSTPIPQLAVQVSIPEYLFGKVFLSKATPIEITIGLFALIAFYYMMRVGEYTVPAATDYEIGSQTRTVQFTVNDVMFWKKRVVMTNWKNIHNPDEATLRLTSQNNDKKNGTIHHDAIQDKSGN